MNVAVISLEPLHTFDPTVRFTLDTIQSVRAGGDRCEAFAVCDGTPPKGHAPGGHLQTSFFHTLDFDCTHRVRLRELLALLRKFDVIWLHHRDPGEEVCEITSAVSGQQALLVTRIGAATHDTGLSRSASRCWSVEPSGGVWSDTMAWDWEYPRKRSRQICTFDALMSASRVEATRAALPRNSALTVVHDCESEHWKRSVLRESEVLVVVPCADTLRDCSGADAVMMSQYILRAVCEHTLPVCTDVPFLRKIMRTLDLSDLLCPDDDGKALSRTLDRIFSMTPSERQERLDAARAGLRRHYLWDTRWKRIRGMLMGDTRSGRNALE